MYTIIKEKNPINPLDILHLKQDVQIEDVAISFYRRLKGRKCKDVTHSFIIHNVTDLSSHLKWVVNNSEPTIIQGKTHDGEIFI